MFDTPKVVDYNFNPALPADHSKLKRKEQLKSLTVDEQVTLRIDDLHKEIRYDTVTHPSSLFSFWVLKLSIFVCAILSHSKEQLHEVFSQFGEVTSIYYPMDLKARVPRGFAFVRYANQRSAERAREAMDDTNLGVGRNIQVNIISAKTYLSQDETGSMRMAQFA